MILLCAQLWGCAGKPPPGSYRVLGQTYTPLGSSAGYSEEGLASWYGADFHGRKTANGEIYDMHGRTAAHKLLPLGTMVEVTHLGNGRTVRARINDRGPFVEGRIIDLTRTLATDLGILEQGVARVRVTAVTGPGGGAPPTDDLDGVFAWQVGAFTVRANAQRLADSLRRDLGVETMIAPYDRGDAFFHRVRVGSYDRVQQADRLLPLLTARSLKPFLVRMD